MKKHTSNKHQDPKEILNVLKNVKAFQTFQGLTDEELELLNELRNHTKASNTS